MTTTGVVDASRRAMGKSSNGMGSPLYREPGRRSTTGSSCWTGKKRHRILSRMGGSIAAPSRGTGRRRGPRVQLSTARTWRGGESQASLLALGLCAAGEDAVVVAQPRSPMARRCRDAGLTVHEIGSRGEFDLVAIIRIAHLLRRLDACLLHAHDAHGVALGVLASRLARVPVLCTRRVDFALRSVRKYRRGMDHVICVSGAIQDLCAAAGVPSDRLSVVHDGIELARLDTPGPGRDELRGELLGGSNGPFLLNVASLADHKDQATLLRAMPRVIEAFPEATLVIAGEGELASSLHQLAASLELGNRCVFAGFRHDVPSLLRACDCFVMSSKLEGLCSSVMDAMAAGRPVVSTRAGGLPELVEDRVTGLLVPVGDPRRLAEALVEVLGDPDLTAALGRAGAAVAADRFGADRMVAGTRRVYARLLDGGASAT